MAGLTATGVGSGLDVNSLVTQLMTVEKQPLLLLDKREASYQTQLTAYGTIKGSMASFQTVMSSLANISTFQSLNAIPADAAILTASAMDVATPGTYSVSVAHLAQSQVLAATGVANIQSASSTGSISLRVGTGAVADITIDSTNNTLGGIRDAINAANTGVTASIVNDGSATPYKLVLTANVSGEANTIQVTNNLTGGELHDAVAGLVEKRAAQDAELTVNGVLVHSASNEVTGVITGVTLNVLKAGDTALTVSRDTTTIKSSVATFVKAYNELNNALKTVTSFNKATGVAGPLLGDAGVQSLQAKLRATASEALRGIGGNLTSLSQIGVTFQKDGSIALDNAKLTAAIASNVGDIAGLFSEQGRPSSTLLKYVGSGAGALAGAYQVNIAAAATYGSASASNAPAASTVIDGGNDAFSVVVNGLSSGGLTLAHGTYTATELAAAVQTALKGSSAYSQAGIAVGAAITDGKLVITSQTYGAASSVAGVSGTAVAALGYTGNESGTGTDVQGNFSLNGTTITATGSGQTLTALPGTSGDALKVLYTGTPAQIAASGSLTLNYSKGYASALYSLATLALDPKGALTNRPEGITASVEDLAQRRTDINERLVKLEARYRAQFRSLDAVVSSMQTQSTFLTQQFEAMAANR